MFPYSRAKGYELAAVALPLNFLHRSARLNLQVCHACIDSWQQLKLTAVLLVSDGAHHNLGGFKWSNFLAA